MTNKERAFGVLKGCKVDRMPAVHFGYWNELLIEWAQQGHIPAGWDKTISDGNDFDRQLDQLLGWDFNWSTVYGSNLGLRPYFEYKILQKLDNGLLRVQNYEGLIEIVKEGIESIPAEDDYQLKDRASYEALYKDKFAYHDDRLNPKLFTPEFNLIDLDRPKGLAVGSVLGSLRNMLSVVGMSYMMFDDYDLFAEIIDTFANMQYEVTKKSLESGAKFDFAHYWEDICFANGPLIPPNMFDDLCAKHYKKRNDLIRQHGIEFISLDCDGVIDELIPTWLNNGVNIMFPLEVGTWQASGAAHIKKFGHKLHVVGGVDKTVLRIDKAAVDKELARIKEEVKVGGLLPCIDHRLMPGTKFDLVKYYIEQIKTILD